MSKKIELKVTWRGIMQSYLLCLEMGDDSNREYAKKELMKLADKLDAYNEAYDIPSGTLKPIGPEKESVLNSVNNSNYFPHSYKQTEEDDQP